jgi:hypothetical protein
MRITAHVAADAVLDRAFEWLCRQRRGWPNSAAHSSFRVNLPSPSAGFDSPFGAYLIEYLFIRPARKNRAYACVVCSCAV